MVRLSCLYTFANVVKVHCRSSSERATIALSSGYCSSVMDTVVVYGGTTFSPESVDVQKSVSPVHNFDCLWQLVCCQMEDGCNEDGEQCWSNDASLPNSCVDPSAVSSPEPVSTVADMLSCSSRSTRCIFLGSQFLPGPARGPEG